MLPLHITVSSMCWSTCSPIGSPPLASIAVAILHEDSTVKPLSHYAHKPSGLLQSFFTRWWQEQSEDTKDLVRKLVDGGQLDFVNGGYVQHDEAAAHYVAMIDQTTLGHR